MAGVRLPVYRRSFIFYNQQLVYQTLYFPSASRLHPCETYYLIVIFIHLTTEMKRILYR